ncbi:MAG: AAA family ATPase [Capsulimonas sp.]|uniref:AAA family ATPase n=1 Tax=Capsulimonas sp. TaxID=2494211 RepID=UPI003265A7B6
MKKNRDAKGPFVHELILNRDRVTSFDSYPYSLPPIRSLSRLKLHPQVTFLIGDNGTGKSTLLEAIAVAAGFNPEGGGRNFNYSTRTSHSSLGDCLTLVKGISSPRDSYFLRAESFFTVATEIERLDEDELEDKYKPPPVIDSYGGKSLHEQSHGESFMALLVHRFGGGGLYLLDEPEAALSPQRQLALLRRMHELLQQGSQFIIATHSPILMAYPNASILQFSAEGIARTEYRETEHYQVTKMFLDDPERMLALLMAPDDRY